MSERTQQKDCSDEQETHTALLLRIIEKLETIDSRTTELCETMHVPSVNANALRGVCCNGNANPVQTIVSIFKKYYRKDTIPRMLDHRNRQLMHYANVLDEVTSVS